jgi:hypothetical protein
MNRNRPTFIVSAVIAGALALTGLVGGAPTPVQAGADASVGKQVLDALCREGKGSVVFTPYSIGRCQEAQGVDGYEIETLVCEGLLGGTFQSAPSAGHMNRTNWACSPGAIVD